RFAPVAHRKLWVYLSGFAERLQCFLVPKRVQRRQPAQEVRLCFFRAGRWEFDAPEFGLLSGYTDHTDETDSTEDDFTFYQSHKDVLLFGYRSCRRRSQVNLTRNRSAGSPLKPRTLDQRQPQSSIRLRSSHRSSHLQARVKRCTFPS